MPLSPSSRADAGGGGGGCASSVAAVDSRPTASSSDCCSAAPSSTLSSRAPTSVATTTSLHSLAAAHAAACVPLPSSTAAAWAHCPAASSWAAACSAWALLASWAACCRRRPCTGADGRESTHHGVIWRHTHSRRSPGRKGTQQNPSRVAWFTSNWSETSGTNSRAAGSSSHLKQRCTRQQPRAGQQHRLPHQATPLVHSDS